MVLLNTCVVFVDYAGYFIGIVFVVTTVVDDSVATIFVVAGVDGYCCDCVVGCVSVIVATTIATPLTVLTTTTKTKQQE